MNGLVLACAAGFVLLQGPAGAQVRGVVPGMSVPDGKLADFYLAVSDYYEVPPLHAVELHERYRCPDEEIPVVYFIAARAHVAPASIVSLRLRRKSWLDIAFHFGLKPDIFFIPLRTDRVGPPYGNAYGYYRRYAPTREWRKMALSDEEVAALVNLRFMSEYYGTPPESVMAMRGRGSSFVAINGELKHASARKVVSKASNKSRKKK